MAKVDYRRLSAARREAHRQILFDAFHASGLSASGQDFLFDLLTESEVTMFARRIAIARLLLLGYSFEHVVADLHVGLQSIVRVDRWLEGKFPLYRSILDPRKKRSRRMFSKPYTFRWFLKRYPTRHMLLTFLLE